jgi:hypothetical protein
MNIQTFFLIVVIVIIVYYLINNNESTNQQSQSNNIINEYLNENGCKGKKLSNTNSQNIINEFLNENICKEKLSSTNSQNIINEFLNENECIEKFQTMGPYINIGNNMDFKQQPITNSSQLSNSLVPDFEPSYLNINTELNSFGYATTNPQSDKYYESRGFINPKKGQEFADSVSYMLSDPYNTRGFNPKDQEFADSESYMLAHPYKTRYCPKN